MNNVRKRNITQLVVALLLSAGVAAFLQPTGVQAQPPSGTNLVKILGQNDPGVIPGAYIVVMKDGTTKTMLSSTIQSVKPTGVRRLGAKPFKRYHTAITGFAGKLSPAELKKLQADPNVAFIEADRVVKGFNSQTLSNLDRIDQRVPCSHCQTYRG